MRVLRLSSFPEMLAAWADSERDKNGIDANATTMDAVMRFVERRTTLFAPLLLSDVRRVYLVSIIASDLAQVRLLNQRDQARDLPTWSADNASDISPYRAAAFRFVAVARMPSLPFVLVDGLHRMASWLSAASHDEAVGFLLTTASAVPIWE